MTTKYTPYVIKGFFLIITLSILYHGRHLLYRFCKFPIPFILCPVCDYPCFFRQYQTPLIVGIVGASIVKGRVFCGMACPVGTVQDIIYIPSSKIYNKININKFIGPVNLNIVKSIDKGLRLLKYPILSISLIFSAITFARVYNTMPDFLYVHALRFVLAVRNFAGHGHENIWYVFLLSAFVIGIFLHRAWCKYLCPVGLIFALTNKLSIFKIKFDRKGCNGCKNCLDGCTTGYQVSKLEKGYDSLECVRCDRCITQCQQNVVNLDTRYFKSK
jgi:polyferredoxin